MAAARGEPAARGRLLDVRDVLVRLAAPPAGSAEEHALLDTWRRVLRERVGRMRARVEDLCAPRRWSVEGALGSDQSLRSILDALCAIHAEAAGASEQLEKARHRVLPPLGFGAFVRPHLRAGSAKDQAAERREQAQRELQAARARSAVLRDAKDAFARGVTAWREDLGAVASGARGLVALLQAAEEERLLARVEGLEVGPRRTEAEGLIAVLAAARAQGREWVAADGARGYGPALRAGWLAPRSRLLGLLGPAARGA
jgi:hypothetical protein